MLLGRKVEEFLKPLTIWYVSHQNSKGNCQIKLKCYQQSLWTISTQKKGEVSAAKKNISYCVSHWKGRNIWGV